VQTVTTLEAEYRGADEVLLALVAFEVSRAATRERPFDLPTEDLVHVAVAINEGFAKVLRWRAGQSSPLALVAGLGSELLGRRPRKSRCGCWRPGDCRWTSFPL